MKILAVDTSGVVAGVSIISDGRVVYEAHGITNYTHSVNMMPMVEEALLQTGLKLKEMAYVAAVVGPGSFTGVRIGVSTVKGLAHGLQVPCIGINGLEALAYNGLGHQKVICPIMDARAGQVYCAAFIEENHGLKRCLPDEALPIEAFLAKGATIGETFYFVGDGVRPYKEAIQKILGEKAFFAGEGQWYMRGANVGLLAWEQRDQAVDYLTLEPYYLRAPQAQRQKIAKEKQALGKEKKS
ncbi:MAG: tRNA (adenosine(37)-N6)-threonylcarbamoyltransferase complex dimerization subunit type 1 TsaB [Clostridiales bacterium]|nr:tRNA (adenosine(37)-N6)-threonylcarbamoyltransferase complex dimerization subunit type 1 TsaB [Clostridiales bacterium]